jgi:hypothetical protein
LLDRLHRAASVWHELLALPWWEEEVPVTLEDLVELVGVLIDLVPTVGEPILQLLKRMMKVTSSSFIYLFVKFLFHTADIF